MHRLTSLAFAVVAVAVLVGAQAQDRPDLQLKAAIYKETVEGDLQGAIALYKQIVSNNAAPRPVAAAALLGLGGCYEKVGEAQARGAYERLIASYPEQTSEVAEARTRLAALKAPSREASSLPTLRLAFRVPWSGSDADASGAVSPDGRLLAYVHWDTGDLAARDLQTGHSRMVTNKGNKWLTDDFATSPRWSPDGKRIAYYWYQDEGYLNQLRIADLSGKNMRVLYSHKQRIVFPIGWLPDGTALLAAVHERRDASEVVRISVEDGAVTPIGKTGPIASSRVSLSPNGKSIAYELSTDPDSLNMDVLVMPSSGGPGVPLVTGPYDDRLLGWTPDGKRILIASNRSGTYDAWLFQVDDGKVVGSPQLLRKGLGLVIPIGFSPDGAFYFEPDVAVQDVMLADWSPDSQEAVVAPTLATEHFTGSTRLAAWSRDGRMLAYLVDRGVRRPAETQVRIRDMETGAERTLVAFAGFVHSLAWSPDGTSVAFAVRGQASGGVCRIVDVISGKIIREIASSRKGGSIYRFIWAPDGRVVYYAVGGGGLNSVVRRDLRTGDETVVYAGAVGNPIDIALSPDGQRLALGLHPQIVVIAATGGEPRDLVRVGPPGGLAYDTLAWSPDGRHLYFGHRLAGVATLFRVAATGGTPEDLKLEVGEELRFRPDGRRLTYTRSKGESRGEIWVMENFLPPAKEAPAGQAQIKE